MAEVTLDGITKQFGTETAVDDIDLTVEEGEILGVVGPSGCGKTTTLRTIAGFETPTAGEVLFDDETMTHVPPEKRNVGLVFQSYALFNNMTVLGNVAFGPKMQGVDEAERHDRARNLLELLDIGDLADRRPETLSGGQQQRVGLARALAIEPAILLLDEPMTGLDAKLKQRLQREIGSLLDELGVTALYVTHDQEEAMTMADQLAVLNDGELQQSGTPLECYNAPNNTFVAGFIGSPQMNMFDGQFTGDSIEFDERSYPLSESIRDEIPSHIEDITLGIRPEDIRLVDSPTENSFPATVNVVELMGDQTHVYTEFEDEECIVTVSAEERLSEDDEIEIVFPASRVHVFNAQTGDVFKNRETQLNADDQVPRI